MKWPLLLVVIFLCFGTVAVLAQPRQEDIFTAYVFFDKRQRLQKDLMENTVGKPFQQQITADNEHRFESACLAISQFLLHNDTVAAVIGQLITQYDSLRYDTRRALLEAIHASYPVEYTEKVRDIIQREKDPKLFAMCAVYLYRASQSVEAANAIKLLLIECFPDYDTHDLLLALLAMLNENTTGQPLPPLNDLFAYHKKQGNKVIYSFQRRNRDFPGMAIVQYPDGSFARHADGRLMVFEQLARAASSLPFFLTNGNTPQGIYSIRGTATSHNQFIGPTPTLQMVMPYEDTLTAFVHNIAGSGTVLSDYLTLLPPSWRGHTPMLQSLIAGKIGRTAIIAHGTTIDPDYYRDRPFFPLTPTMGCLCAKELWNVTSGKLLVSEQFNLFRAYTATPGSKGYLMVIELDDRQAAVSRAEVEKITGR